MQILWILFNAENSIRWYNKKDKLLELVIEEYLSKEDYKKQVDLINEDLTIYQTKMNELKSKKVLYFFCDFGYIINRSTILTYLS